MAKQELTYSKAYAELEAIIAQIEDESISIDELSVKVKRASELLQFCRKKLQQTESEIENIFKEMETGSKS